MGSYDAEVHRLLTEHFAAIETLWDERPYEEAVVVALTIKEFMVDREITSVEEGIRSFARFKEEQSQELALLGLGGSPDPGQDRRAAVRRLVTGAV